MFESIFMKDPDSLSEMLPNIVVMGQQKDKNEYLLSIFEDENRQELIGEAVWNTNEQRIVLTNKKTGNMCRSSTQSESQLTSALKLIGLYRKPSSPNWQKTLTPKHWRPHVNFARLRD